MKWRMLELQAGINRLKGPLGIICVLASVFYMYVGFYGQISQLTQMVPLLTIAIVMGFKIHPLMKSKKLWSLLIDYLLIGLAIWDGIYLIATEKMSAMAIAPPTGLRLYAAYVLIFLVLEATRRVMGIQLVLFVCTALLYAKFGNYVTGIFHHWGFEWSRIADYTSLSTEGIFGAPIYVCATIIVYFLIFSAFLRIAGGSDFFINVSQSFVGKFRGGTAKIAVIASTFFGMISGSAVANVSSVGAITIPMMIKAGYKPIKAASVEALASTGGQFMPPVMGAAAFLMADIIGRAYWDVCVAAFIPAFLYYISLFLIVDFEAAKMDLKGIDPKLISPWATELRKGWFFLFPLVILFVFLGWIQVSAMRASLYAIVSLVIVSFFTKKTRMGAMKIYEGLEAGMRGMTEVTLACACGGIMIGMMYLTNFGVGLSTALVTISKGNSFVLLVLTALTSLALGIGLTTSACYLLLAIMVAPTMVKMGIPVMAAHLFILYYGCLSTITPPVATASYAAASLAGTKPIKTGWNAFAWGAVAYILPFFFIYHPLLVLHNGSIVDIIIAVMICAFGVAAIAGAIQGHCLTKINIPIRIIFGISGIVMFFPNIVYAVSGLTIFIGISLWQRFLVQRRF